MDGAGVLSFPGKTTNVGDDDRPWLPRMKLYRLRFAFDTGAGVCLWAANDTARERFGYAVESSELTLPPVTQRRLEALLRWHNTGLDWSDPAGPSPWSEEERQRFNREAQAVLRLLREQLGPKFLVTDESGTAARPAADV